MRDERGKCKRRQGDARPSEEAVGAKRAAAKTQGERILRRREKRQYKERRDGLGDSEHRGLKVTSRAQRPGCLDEEVKRDEKKRRSCDPQRKPLGALRAVGVSSFLGAEPHTSTADAEESTTALIPNPIKDRLPVETAVATAVPPTIVFHPTVRAQRRAARRRSVVGRKGEATSL